MAFVPEGQADSLSLWDKTFSPPRLRLEYWSTGVLECWIAGVLECRSSFCAGKGDDILGNFFVPLSEELSTAY
jgi:hypothetical protein